MNQYNDSARRIAAAAIGLVLALPVGLQAQRVATQKRGLSSAQAFQIGDLDTVGLFNGALTLVLPIGQAYSVGPRFTYRLQLVNNHFGWDYEPCPNGYIQRIPDEKYNTGFGWMLNLGRLEPSQPFTNPPFWTYTGASGSEHGFYDQLHPGTTPQAGVFYSRNSQYQRLRHFPTGSASCETPTQATAACALLEFGGGVVHEFRNFTTSNPPDYRLTQMRDADGNAVDVTYPAAGTSWEISDPYGRVQEIVFSGAAGEYERVSEVRVTEFGGGTAVYGLEYESASIERPNFVPNTCAGGQFAATDLLRRVVLPDGSFYGFDYYRDNVTPTELSGAARSLQVRTGGELRFTYQHLSIPSQQEADPFDPAPPPTFAYAVATKEIAETPGGSAIGTWSYRFDPVADTAPGESNPCHRTTTVTSPAGDETVHYFTTTLTEQWSYSLPFTRCAPGVGWNTTGPFLSMEVYAGSVATGTKLRSVFVEYGSSGLQGRATQEVNARLEYRQTMFHDDGSSDTTVRLNDFDGVGNFRTLTVAGSFSDQDDRIVFTNFNPGNGTLVVDPVSESTAGSTFVMPSSTSPWILDTFTERSETADNTTITSEFCFDAATGFLERQRVLAGAGRANNDLLTVFTKNGSGFVTEERLYGGDTQGTLDATYDDLCLMTLPATPAQYRTDHTWSSGALATSTAMDPCDGTALLSLVDNTIDASTGLVSSSRDAAGVSTSFVYDELSRLTGERPLGSAWTSIEYELPSTTAPDLEAMVTVRTCANGLTTCTTAAALAWEQMRFDALGRLSEERIRLPTTMGEAEHARTFTYDAQGRRLTESMWASPANLTIFSAYDPFGRVGTVTLPDGTATHFTYEGARTTTRQTEVRLATGTASAFTTEIFDVRGRLIEVCEDRATAWQGTCDGLLTRYTYGVTSQLKHVCHNADDETCGQTRSFVHDGQGFLNQQTHPEIGATGNGTITYTRDARGNALSKRVVGASQFDLNFKHDAAGRLTHVDEDNGGAPRPLKEFFYGAVNSGSDLRAGKLVQTKRHNWADIVGPLPLNSGSIDAVVTEVIRYEGLDGRPSAKQTRFSIVALGLSHAFDFSQTYDELGNVASITYPQCRHGQANCPSVAPARAVTFNRLKGFLRGVPGFANRISYQSGGMLHLINHANGVSSTVAINAGTGMARPYRITTSAGWNTGIYQYDGTGNIMRIGTQRYRYDRRHQLTSGEVLVDGVLRIQATTIDDYGNITNLVTNGVTQSTPVSTTTNRLSSPLGSYDGGGNLTNLILGTEEYQHTYDGVNMMKHLQSNTDLARTFIYNADDERIAQFDCTVGVCATNPVVETWTLRDFGNRVLRTYLHRPKDGWFWKEDYVYRDDKLLASISPQGTSHLHLDHLGTPRQITDSAGAQTSFHSYYPFGEEATTVSAGEIAVKFTGHERDPNGVASKGTLDYMHARYSNPFLGRFSSVDPVSGDLGIPLSWNRYSYGLNNPMRFVDPNGEDALDTIGGFFNALASDFLFGAGRRSPPNSDFARGQRVGDATALVVGLIEIDAGVGAIVAGAGCSAVTAGGCLPVGGPAVAIGAAEVAHGVITVNVASQNLVNGQSMMGRGSEGGRSAGDVKVVDKKQLKQKGVDAEGFKIDVVGKGSAKRFNIGIDTKGKVVLVPVKKGAGEMIETGIRFDQLIAQ